MRYYNYSLILLILSCNQNPNQDKVKSNDKTRLHFTSNEIFLSDTLVKYISNFIDSSTINDKCILSVYFDRYLDDCTINIIASDGLPLISEDSLIYPKFYCIIKGIKVYLHTDFEKYIIQNDSQNLVLENSKNNQHCYSTLVITDSSNIFFQANDVGTVPFSNIILYKSDIDKLNKKSNPFNK